MKLNCMIVVLFVLVAQLSMNAGCVNSTASATHGGAVVQGNGNRVGGLPRDGRIVPAGIPLFFDVPFDVIDVEIFVSTFEWFKEGVVLSVFSDGLVLAARRGECAPLKDAFSRRLLAAEDKFLELVINSPVSLRKASRARAQVRAFFSATISKIIDFLRDMSDDQIIEVMTETEVQIDRWITHLKAVRHA